MANCELNQIFLGEIASVQNYGAFIRIPGCSVQGLIHRSQISCVHVDNVTEVLQKGERVWCKVISIGDDGKIGLSMKYVNQGNGTDLDPNGVQLQRDIQKKKIIEKHERIEKLTNRKIIFVQCDVTNLDELQKVFEKYKFHSVIHFAALKAVGESCEKPLEYYKTNVCGTLNLLKVMKEFNVKCFIYSSSATVYGIPEKLPLVEDMKTGNCTNPYGKTKYMVEEILKDLCISDKAWSVISLRYFNPVGAHSSGLIGEDPNGIPNNLMPYIAQVSVGKREILYVYGNDYDTPDGTGIRDYIHITDLAVGHVKAMIYQKIHNFTGFKVFNLGTGKGYSVLEVIRAFEKASGRNIPYKIIERRPGDISASYADASLANKELGWQATKNIDNMCLDTWRWQQNNPNGYKSS